MAAAERNDMAYVLDSIRPSLRDEQYDSLLKRLEPRKRGRPSFQKTDMPFTNRLLMQLHLARQESNCSWSTLQSLFNELCAAAELHVHNVAHLIQTCLYQIQSVDINNEHDGETFLNKELEKLEWLGEFSKKHSVSKDLLLSISSGTAENIVPLAYISNGLLNEINVFRNRKGFHTRVLLLWLKTLCTEFEMMNTGELNKLLKKVSTEMKQKQRRKGDTGGVFLLQEYKDRSCLSSSTETTVTLTDSGEGSSSSRLLAASAVAVNLPVAMYQPSLHIPCCPSLSVWSSSPLQSTVSDASQFSAQHPSGSTSLHASSLSSSVDSTPPSALLHLCDFSSLVESVLPTTSFPLCPPSADSPSQASVESTPPSALPQSCSLSTDCALPTTGCKSLQFDKLVKETEVNTLKEIIQEKDHTISCLKKEVDKLLKSEQSLKDKLKTVKKNENTLTEQLREKRKECSVLKQTNLYRQCSRLKHKVLQQQQQLQQLQNIEVHLEQEKTLKRRAQVRSSQLQAKKRKLQQTLEEREDAIRALEQEEAAAAIGPPPTRDASGKFTESVVKCVMQLVAENEVPAGRCADVIRTISRNIFNISFEDNTLPSKTSALRFADQVHSIAHMHIAEELSNKKYDLHLDGTSKSTKKFVGMQVTLENKKTLSLGLDPVAHETAQTLLDLALNKLSEFALLQSPEDADGQLKNMLRNLVAIMSDRAANAKAAGKQLDQHIKQTVDPAIQIEFIHCNAHFLLGLTAAADKALTAVAETAGLQGKLGRDAMPAFQRFKSPEVAACRYIRMACDTLGPRGDEKSGCHHLWLAFCSTQEETSAITSFRANRFNNLFCAAAALIHHRRLITSFFDHRASSNLKQKSVEADARCDQLAVMVQGLALMYVYIAGPFWCLVNSDIHYLDQYLYIQPLFFFLCEMEQHPDILLGSPEDIPHDIESFRLRAQKNPTVESVLQFRHTAAAIDRNLFLQVIKALATHFRQTVERQLKDFLPDVKYGRAPNDEARQRMAHCQLTNLLGEACFADLDYSMFKSRGATLHHHSTLNLGKRNQPVSQWLQWKTPEEQTLLLGKARKLAPGMRMANKQKQLIVLEELNEAMQEKQRTKEEKEQKQLQMKQNLMAEIQAQGGPCKTRTDVDNLVETCRNKTATITALKLQSRFYREFFGAKLLLSNLTPEQLATNLCQFLDSLPTDADPPLAAAEQEGRDSEDEPVPEELELENFDFQFSAQGQSVAVFYDDKFYIGQVLLVHRPDLADVSFLNQRGKENVFKWPSSESIEQVSACFVFHSDFDLIERYRVWAVTEAEWACLKRRWRQFLQLIGID